MTDSKTKMWVKRAEVPSAADVYSDIWDGDGWQINQQKEEADKPFLLLDAMMPHWVPASSVIGTFATLEEAMSHAASLGKPDWSDVETDEEFYTHDR